MPEIIDDPGLRAPIKTWLPPAEIDAAAMEQLRYAARHPDVGPRVAVMPDCHVGFGVTIGCVFPTRGAVVPTVVGVDIACFTGDTLIPTLDGRSYRLRDLHERGEGAGLRGASRGGGRVLGHHMNVGVILGRLRLFLQVLAAGLFVGTIGELVPTEHYAEPYQLVPFALCGLGLVAMALVRKRPSRRTVGAVRAVMVVVALSSLVGTYQHVTGNLELPRELRPNAGTRDLVRAA